MTFFKVTPPLIPETSPVLSASSFCLKPLFPLALVAQLMVAPPLHADPWVTHPGTKARAMGTAFVSVADDASAAWYNPAGAARLNTLTLEYATAPSVTTTQLQNNFDLSSPTLVNAWNDYSDDDDKLFFAAVAKGIGLFVHQPYNLQFPIQAKLNPRSFDEARPFGGTDTTGEVIDSVEGNLAQEVTIFGLVLSRELQLADQGFLNAVSLGLTLEYIDNEVTSGEGNSSSNFANDDALVVVPDNFLCTLPEDEPGTYSSCVQDTSNTNITDIDPSEYNGDGLSGSIGTIVSLYQPAPDEFWVPKVQFGGVYRFESFYGGYDEDITISRYRDGFGGEVVIAAEDLFVSKPASWDVGLSMASSFRLPREWGLGVLSLAMQYGETLYSSAGALLNADYQRTAFGGELQIITPQDISVSFRLGTYQAKAPDAPRVVGLSGAGLPFPDTKAITYGVGVNWKEFSVEFAVEDRTLENALVCQAGTNCTVDSGDFDQQFYSVSLRYSKALFGDGALF